MSVYTDLIDIIKEAKDKGVAAVAVYKPDTQREQGEPEDPDLIVCTHEDPDVISALLGNYQVNIVAEDCGTGGGTSGGSYEHEHEDETTP
jgi:hypothetical protein